LLYGDDRVCVIDLPGVATGMDATGVPVAGGVTVGDTGTLSTRSVMITTTLLIAFLHGMILCYT
jgi:hypothetical protein